MSAASLPVLNALITTNATSWIRSFSKGSFSKGSTSKTPQSWSMDKSTRSGSKTQDSESQGTLVYEGDVEKGRINMPTDSPASSVVKQPSWDEYYTGMQVPGTAR